METSGSMGQPGVSGRGSRGRLLAPYGRGGGEGARSARAARAPGSPPPPTGTPGLPAPPPAPPPALAPPPADYNSQHPSQRPLPAGPCPAGGPGSAGAWSRRRRPLGAAAAAAGGRGGGGRGARTRTPTPACPGRCPTRCGTARSSWGCTWGQVPELELTPLETPESLPPTLAHGTRRRLWDSIRRGGLSRRGRTHIHLAPGLPGDAGVLSGMRPDSEVAVVIDGPQALADGIRFFRAANGVVLTPGDAHGVLPPRYILCALQLRPSRCLLPLD
ncbi:tRNA 2'-phosphotransferase 1 isoform X1 [Alligator mississippiensis]|uniref:tRNA 2'-phosphotransferase 1 isoform X1 n=1 Tax=Alligator mississippiensis TaxID=8496 RepID=UPI002877E02B|nr:tRNA 2'-phosphotransferase 1 isoform X1 [Alligator mississippiensis]